MTGDNVPRRPRRRLTAIVAACMVVAAACGSDGDDDDNAAPESETERPASVERIRLAGGEYGYPTPFAYVRGSGMIQTSFVFDTLLWEDSTGDPGPWLAREWSHSADGLEWRFTLRDDVMWHDGRPLTAEDVKFSFEYVTTGAASKVGRFGGRFDLKEVVVESPSVVVVRLGAPTAVFEEDVGMRLFIIPRHIWADVTDPGRFRGADAVIGSGPYQLESADEASGSYLYTANDGFWGGPPYVKRLEFVPAPDELLALGRGEVDAAQLLEEPAPATQLEVFESDDRFGKLEGSFDWNLVLNINLTEGFPYDRKEFRQALAFTIDRQDMVERLLQGRGAPGNAGGLPPDHPYFAPDLPGYERDVAKAGSLLDEIGLRDADGDGLRELPDGSRFAPELHSSSRFTPKSAELIKEYLREVGVDLSVRILDPAAADTSTGEGNYTMALVGYGGMAGDPDQNMRGRYAAPPTSTSFTRAIGYSDPAVSEAAERQATLLDTEQRKPLIHQIQRIVAEDVPILPLYYPRRTTFFRAAVFDGWYYTPGCSPCGGTRNKHMLVTGKKVGF